METNPTLTADQCKEAKDKAMGCTHTFGISGASNPLLALAPGSKHRLLEHFRKERRLIAEDIRDWIAAGAEIDNPSPAFREMLDWRKALDACIDSLLQPPLDIVAIGDEEPKGPNRGEDAFKSRNRA